MPSMDRIVMKMQSGKQIFSSRESKDSIKH
jgi:hypothetical protein